MGKWGTPPPRRHAQAQRTNQPQTEATREPHVQHCARSPRSRSVIRAESRVDPNSHQSRIKVGFLWRKPTLMRLWYDFDANRTRDKCARKASTRRATGKRDATVISSPTHAAHPSVRQRKRPRKKTSTPYEQSEGLQLKR